MSTPRSRARSSKPSKPSRPSRPRSRPSTGERLPLNLRAPNPPPVFVGRAREADALEAALRRAPLACVWGMGGLGKSSLVFHVLHERFPEQVPRAIVLRIGRDEAIDEALVTVAMALAEIQGVTGIAWRSLIEDRDALVATALDLAEGAGGPPAGRGRGREAPAYWVILDDMHHADPARAGQVLAELARYGRRSRWLVVGRTNALPEEALGQAVMLGAMAPDDLLEIGRRWGAPSMDPRVIAEAAGSPWRLKQLFHGVTPGLEPGARDPLVDLPPGVAPFLADLSLVDAELPASAIARFTELPPPDALAALERRGIIERRPGGLRLHDVARAFAAARLDAALAKERRLHVARALCEDPADAPPARARAAQGAPEGPDLSAWLEGLRLLVEEGDSARAAAELDRRAGALLEASHVLSLWRALERAAAPELASWRLRCATAIGDPPTLRGIPKPPSPTARDEERWALSLFQQGRYEEAQAAGKAARQAASDAGDPGLAFDAGRSEGRAAVALGRFEHALATFEGLTAETPKHVVQRHADVAVCLVSLERHEAALEHLREVEARVTADASLVDATLCYSVMWALFQCGSLYTAERWARRRSASSGGVRLYGLASGRFLFAAAALAYERGALAEASSLIEKLLPVAVRSPVYALFAGILRATIRVAAGELDGIEEEAERLSEAASKTPRKDLIDTASALRTRALLALGEPPSGPPPAVEASHTVWGDNFVLWDAMHRARWGAWGRELPAVGSAAPEVRILARLCEAWIELAAGEAGAAARIAEGAAAQAVDSGHGLLEVYARECAAVAALIADAPSESARASADALWALARERGVGPLAVEGELLSMLASPERLDPARLEAIAASPVAIAASKRARALLGDPARLGRVDEALVHAARRRAGFRIERIGGFGGGSPLARGPAWGLDERTQSIWLNGRSLSLADRPLLWRILRVLAGEGGAADKETLMSRAWGQRDYHPLRDDARLHTAIRTLRRVIEEDPARPSRLVTTEVGYALGRDAVVRLLAPTRAPA